MLNFSDFLLKRESLQYVDPTLKDKLPALQDKLAGMSPGSGRPNRDLDAGLQTNFAALKVLELFRQRKGMTMPELLVQMDRSFGRLPNSTKIIAQLIRDGLLDRIPITQSSSVNPGEQENMMLIFATKKGRDQLNQIAQGGN